MIKEEKAKLKPNSQANQSSPKLGWAPTNPASPKWAFLIPDEVGVFTYKQFH